MAPRAALRHGRRRGLTGFGLWALGVPLPLALGLIAGPLNFVPYLGLSSVPRPRC